MTGFKEIEECLEEIKNRYNNNEKVRKKLARYDDPIQIKFLDTEREVLILVNKDEGIEIKDNSGDDTAPVKLRSLML